MMFVDLTSGLPHVQANALRALAVTRMQRSTLFPELPSLHEAGVELAVLGDLVGNVRFEGRDPEPVARVKGDLRMAAVVTRAVRDRQRPLRNDLRVGYGLRSLWLTVEQSEAIVKDAKRRFRTHNGARRFVEAEVFAALAASHPTDAAHAADAADGSVVCRGARATDAAHTANVPGATDAADTTDAANAGDAAYTTNTTDAADTAGAADASHATNAAYAAGALRLV